MQLDGVFPAVTTPFTSNGDVDLDALEGNLRVFFASQLRGVLLLGSTGESVHLSEREMLSILERGSQLLPSDKLLLVGAPAGSLQLAAAWTKRLEGYPVAALLAGAPSYFKARMTAEALYRYYQELADAAPFPLLLYNVPQFSGLSLPVEVVVRLSRHPRIIGMKESSGDLIYAQRILAATGSDFQFLTGSSQVLGPSLTLGIRGAILAVASALPDLPVRLIEAFLAGEEIGELQGCLCRFSDRVSGQYGIPGLKHAMDLLGLRGGHSRLPLLPLEEDEKLAIASALNELGLRAAGSAGGVRS